jgi:hypothetical protein
VTALKGAAGDVRKAAIRAGAAQPELAKKAARRKTKAKAKAKNKATVRRTARKTTRRGRKTRR